MEQANKLYVGNLPYSATETELRSAFSAHGEVSEATVIMDRESGRSKGFGFVTMATEEGAQAAIAAMNGTTLEGSDRPLVVNAARPREERPAGGGFGGGNRGGNRNGGGNWGNSNRGGGY